MLLPSSQFPMSISSHLPRRFAPAELQHPELFSCCRNNILHGRLPVLRVNVSGYAAGSGNLIQQTLFNSGTAIETVTYTVSPSAFGCPPGIPQNVVVTVNPKPAVTNSIRNFNICSCECHQYHSPIKRSQVPVTPGQLLVPRYWFLVTRPVQDL